MLAEASELLGAGCRERALAGGQVALDFWCEDAAAPAAHALGAALEARGCVVSVDSRLEEADWQGPMRAFHRPVEIAGRLFLRPPWEPARTGWLDVVIEPGMAFGTGQHATTRACLELLCELQTEGPLLDVGCGSGVLAIAAARLGHRPVLAIDADPLAVAATEDNARQNGVELRAWRAQIGVDPFPPASTVLANLTATALGPLAEALAPAPPRRAVLSGLRPHEVEGVLGRYRPLSLHPARRLEREGWATVLVEAG